MVIRNSKNNEKNNSPQQTNDSDTPSVRGRGKIRLFVYGTLKQDHHNNILLRGAEFLGYDMIQGFYRMVDFGGFPGIIRVPEGERDGEPLMFGEVWAVNQDQLRAVDLLEGHPKWYTREKVWTKRLERRVWVYTLPSNWEDRANDLVLDGIWRPTVDESAFWEQEGITFDGR